MSKPIRDIYLGEEIAEGVPEWELDDDPIDDYEEPAEPYTDDVSRDRTGYTLTSPAIVEPGQPIVSTPFESSLAWQNLNPIRYEGYGDVGPIQRFAVPPPPNPVSDLAQGIEDEASLYTRSELASRLGINSATEYEALNYAVNTPLRHARERVERIGVAANVRYMVPPGIHEVRINIPITREDTPIRVIHQAQWEQLLREIYQDE